MACGVAGLLAACTPQAAQEEPVRAVKVMTVRPQGLQAVQEFSGEVRPRIESRLGFRVAGKLVSREVELGQRVRAGQLLARLDPQDYRLAADAAQAQLRAAMTQRDLAAADFRRYQELREQNFISGAELERRQAALQAAQAQVDQAQAQLAAQRNQGAYTSLVADAPGVVTAIEAEIGQVVSAGQPVVRLAQDGARDAVITVPEDKRNLMPLGTTVQVRVWPGQSVLQGRVRELSASADPVTRTYQVKVALEGQPLPPLGATVTVQPKQSPEERQTAIKLPTSALRQDGQATAVWVLDTQTMTVRSQPVQIATADGNEAVVTAGLQEGQQVVIAGVHVLSPGQKVMLYREKAAAALGSPAQTAVGATLGAATAAPAGK
ncbi:MAG: efflux RND transporter periplasmic adaptor subunit [Caldimonas manganoxidans]|nr:efflux RND transporter periplasmic adaptor subunit [Caldimonas manganoxidans]